MLKDVTVVMLTSPGRGAVWETFQYSFRKYWPDCPWRFAEFTGSIPWSDFVGHVLTAHIRTPHVLQVLDDHWLCGPVQTDVLVELASYLANGTAEHIRLLAGDMRYTGYFPHDDRLTVSHPTERYRASLQAGFWNVETYRGLLRPGESAWEFESRSAKRTKGSYRYLCVRSNAYFPYTIGPEWDRGIVKRGEWSAGARKYAEIEGLDIDFRKGLGG